MKEISAGAGGSSKLPVICQTVADSVLAGDNAYDAAYLPVAHMPNLLIDGSLTDIASLPNVHMDREWWDKTISDALSVSGKSMVASSPANLMSFDMSWVILFNHELLEERKMELPYQSVKDGKWTLDKMLEYESSFASMNGDSSWAYSDAGKAVYGVGRHADSFDAFLYASDVHFATLNKDNTFTYDFTGEKLIKTMEKQAALFDPTVGHGVGSAGSPHYLNTVFKNNRALFVTCELKAAMELRDMESQFGLLPFPKYDESQQGYHTNLNRSTCFLTVPSYVKKTAEVGAILDGLSYESYQSLIPIYYDEVVTYQGLRNQESLEMLEIIRQTRGIEFSQVFGITTGLHSTLSMLTAVGTGTGLSSTVASLKDSTVALADEVLKNMKK